MIEPHSRLCLTFLTKKNDHICRAPTGLFSPNPLLLPTCAARLAPYELTHVRASSGDCAAGWAQAWRNI